MNQKLSNPKLLNQELQMDSLRESGHNQKDPTKATTKETTKGTTKKQREPKRNLKGPKRNRMKAVSRNVQLFLEILIIIHSHE